jgi:hypothetical protein
VLDLIGLVRRRMARAAGGLGEKPECAPRFVRISAALL